MSPTSSHQGSSPALNHFRAFDYADLLALPGASMPTVFIWGSDDRYLAEPTARATRAHVTGRYSEVRFDGIGHGVPELAAQQVTDLLVAHLPISTH